MSAVRRLLARWRCSREGHVNAMTVLPEDGWGLYAYSRLWCSRCGKVEHEPDIWAELAHFNVNRNASVDYDPAYLERMAIQQGYFDDLQRARTDADDDPDPYAVTGI